MKICITFTKVFAVLIVVKFTWSIFREVDIAPVAIPFGGKVNVGSLIHQYIFTDVYSNYELTCTEPIHYENSTDCSPIFLRFACVTKPGKICRNIIDSNFGHNWTLGNLFDALLFKDAYFQLHTSEAFKCIEYVNITIPDDNETYYIMDVPQPIMHDYRVLEYYTGNLFAGMAMAETDPFQFIYLGDYIFDYNLKLNYWYNRYPHDTLNTYNHKWEIKLIYTLLITCADGYKGFYCENICEESPRNTCNNDGFEICKKGWTWSYITYNLTKEACDSSNTTLITDTRDVRKCILIDYCKLYHVKCDDSYICIPISNDSFQCVQPIVFIASSVEEELNFTFVEISKDEVLTLDLDKSNMPAEIIKVSKIFWSSSPPEDYMISSISFKGQLNYYMILNNELSVNMHGILGEYFLIRMVIGIAFDYIVWYTVRTYYIVQCPTEIKIEPKFTVYWGQHINCSFKAWPHEEGLLTKGLSIWDIPSAKANYYASYSDNITHLLQLEVPMEIYYGLSRLTCWTKQNFGPRRRVYYNSFDNVVNVKGFKKFNWEPRGKLYFQVGDTLTCDVQAERSNFVFFILSMDGNIEKFIVKDKQVTIPEIIQPGPYELLCKAYYFSKVWEFYQTKRFHISGSPTYVCIMPYPRSAGGLVVCNSNGYPQDELVTSIYIVMQMYDLVISNLNNLNYVRIPYHINTGDVSITCAVWHRYNRIAIKKFDFESGFIEPNSKYTEYKIDKECEILIDDQLDYSIIEINGVKYISNENYYLDIYYGQDKVTTFDGLILLSYLVMISITLIFILYEAIKHPGKITNINAFKKLARSRLHLKIVEQVEFELERLENLYHIEQIHKWLSDTRLDSYHYIYVRNTNSVNKFKTSFPFQV